ncbi:peptide ABC transporter substrate-binding protein [Leuconostoc holzapfelii]|uniref:Peptide ABC transporter substrate-binding protein n=1 Tax=Leuconostoc holzapfelii TaxID=434464 RepID=A0ABT2NXL1_9LACO|nr:peptide ABC transporter substrate-binding protein [Leuconostoc holzapfelii]MCT8388806.1 peptide ABC transporter substrate-binding protein [Leuconostoc holzapfelii]
MKNWQKYAAGGAVVVVALVGTRAAGLWGNAQGGNHQVLHFSLPTPLNGLDTATITDEYSMDIAGNAGEGVMRADKNGTPQPAQAQSVKASADGKTWTITLRPNLKWSDGSKLTAADFVYGWQRANDPATKSEYAYLYSGIKNADKIQAGQADKKTLGITAKGNVLTVTLEKPMPQFESLLTFPTFFPQQEKFVTKQGKGFATTSAKSLYNGPYKFEGWQGTNNEFKLVKNDNYWDAKHVKTPEIDFQVIQKPEVAVQMYKTGKLDAALVNTPQLAQANKGNKGYRVTPQATTVYLAYNQSGSVKALTNDKIRQALNLATNRPELNAQVLSGTSTSATTFTPKGLSQANGEDFATYAKQDYSYDPTKAQALFKSGLAEIGATSVTLEIEADTDRVANAKDVVNYLQGQWSKVLPGLKVTEKFVPFKQRLQDGTNKNFQIMLTQWGADYAEPTTFLDLAATDNPNNYNHNSTPAYDALLAKATGVDATNDSKRAVDEQGMEKMIHEQALLNPLYYQAQPELVNPQISGFYHHAVGVPLDFKTAVRQ